MRSEIKTLPNFEKEGQKLDLQNISFAWKTGEKILDQCNLSISSPGLWMLVGCNGSGKSTLFRLIGGLLRPQGGHLFCSFKPALVLQNPDHQLLLPSCGSDLLVSLPSGLSAFERNQRIDFLLSDVGLKGMADRPIHTLSGGQKQRLALAGALASQANLLLLDEPTALLDPLSQRSILEIVRRMSRRTQERPITAIWITHRLEELTYCDGAAIMEKGRVGSWFSGEKVFQKLT